MRAGFDVGRRLPRCCASSPSPTCCWRSCMFSVTVPVQHQRVGDVRRPTPSWRRPSACCRRPSPRPRSSCRSLARQPGLRPVRRGLGRRAGSCRWSTSVGFGLWLVQFSFPTAAVARFTQQVTQRGLSNASWSAFYNVVPATDAPRSSRSTTASRARSGRSCAACCCWPPVGSWPRSRSSGSARSRPQRTVVVVIGIRRRYGASLLAALRDGRGERVLEGGPGVAALVRDPSVGPALLDGHGTRPNPGVREMAATLLATSDVAGDGRLALRSGLAATPMPGCGRRRSGRDRRDRPAGSARRTTLADLGATDPDPVVRAAVTVAPRLPGQPGGAGFVDDPSDAVRAAAIARLGDMPLATDRRERATIRALDDPDGPRPGGRGGRSWRGDDGPTDGVVGWPWTGRSWRPRRRSARSPDGPSGRDRTRRSTSPSSTFALERVGRATDLRRDRTALRRPRRAGAGRPGRPARRHASRYRERDLLRAGLGALAVLGRPGGAGPHPALSARPTMPQVRAQAIEALDSIGDRRLARPSSACSRTTARRRPPRPAAALDRLVHDEDPWLRRLAQACRGDADVPDATRSLSDLEHDARPAPRAALRGPRSRGPAADRGDGRRAHVRTRARCSCARASWATSWSSSSTAASAWSDAEPDGTDRSSGRTAPGEHIGELAVLRERPRAATVVAEADGARGLVVVGRGAEGHPARAARTPRWPCSPPSPSASAGNDRTTARPTGRLPTGTVTFLRTDVEGSMGLARPPRARAGTSVNAAHLAHRSASAVERARRRRRPDRGRRALRARSARPGRRAAAAVDAQRAIARRDRGRPDAPIRVRMGLHIGRGAPGRRRLRRLRGQPRRPHRGGRPRRPDRRVRATTAALDRRRSCRPGTPLDDLGHAPSSATCPRPERLYQLTIDGLPADFPPLRTAGGVGGNLPDRLTSFLGRDARAGDDRASCSATARLVTLTGPGGIGKTSLADRGRARSSRRRIPDGAWFVALADVDDPAEVPAAIAHGIGLLRRPGAARGRRPSLPYLADRSMVLVLDNFEHVLEAADHVAALVRASPASRVIVTSRAPLHVVGRARAPGPPARPTTASGLFIERARAVRPGWEPGGGPRRSSRRSARCWTTCRWASSSPPRASRSAAGRHPRPTRRPPAAARTRPRDAPAASARSTSAVAWSHDLLTRRTPAPAPRAGGVRGRLRPRAGRRVRRAAASVGDRLDDLLELADHSLIVAVPEATGRVRFRMLRTIQTFALARLADDGDEADVRRRHAEAFLELVRTEQTRPQHVAARRGTRPGRARDGQHPGGRALGDRRGGRASSPSGSSADLWRFWHAFGLGCRGTPT